MTPRILLAGLLALAAFLPLASHAVTDGPEAGEKVITMRLEGTLTVDPDGRVHDYAIRSKMPKEVQSLLSKAIPTWRFEPVLVDGKPVLAESPMRLVIAAQEEGEYYRLRIDNVLFRPNTPEEYAAQLEEYASDGVGIRGERIAPPHYPAKLQAAGREGIVLLVLRIAPEGHVEEAFVKQSSLFNGRDRPAALQRDLAAFERNALFTAKAWRFRVDVRDRAKLSPKSMTVAVPVLYQLGDREIEGSWRREFRSPNRRTPWLVQQDDEPMGVSDMSDGDVLTGRPKLALLNRDEALGEH